MARLAALLVVLAAVPAAAADFVGPESCRACHAAAYDAWKNSPHARALESLSAAQQKDGTCVQCHAKDVAQGGSAGVTCETCHGAGQYYWPGYVMKDAELSRATGLVMPDAKSCALCHDAQSPSLQPFDPAVKMAAIDHWTASRAARKAGEKKSSALCPRRKGQLALNRPGEDFLSRVLRSPGTRPAGPAVALAQAARPHHD